MILESVCSNSRAANTGWLGLVGKVKPRPFDFKGLGFHSQQPPFTGALGKLLTPDSPMCNRQK